MTSALCPPEKLADTDTHTERETFRIHIQEWSVHYIDGYILWRWCPWGSLEAAWGDILLCPTETWSRTLPSQLQNNRSSESSVCTLCCIKICKEITSRLELHTKTYQKLNDRTLNKEEGIKWSIWHHLFKPMLFQTRMTLRVVKC